MARPKEPAGVVEDSEMVTDVAAEEIPPKGKKRIGKEKDPTEERPKKRAKATASTEPTVKISSVKKPLQSQKVKIAKDPPAKPTTKKKTPIVVKWKVLPPKKAPISEASEKINSTELRPRIWTNNREELLAMLPEMAGSRCFNGISWFKYHTPLLLLDQTNTSFEVQRESMDAFKLDLITTRSFVCPMPTKPTHVEDLVNQALPAASEAQPLMHDMIGQKNQVPPRRKAPKYGIPKSSLDAKVEFVRLQTLGSTVDPSISISPSNPLINSNMPIPASKNGKGRAIEKVIPSATGSAPRKQVANSRIPAPMSKYLSVSQRIPIAPISNSSAIVVETENPETATSTNSTIISSSSSSIVQTITAIPPESTPSSALSIGLLGRLSRSRNQKSAATINKSAEIDSFLHCAIKQLEAASSDPKLSSSSTVTLDYVGAPYHHDWQLQPSSSKMTLDDAHNSEMRSSIPSQVYYMKANVSDSYGHERSQSPSSSMVFHQPYSSQMGTASPLQAYNFQANLSDSCLREHRQAPPAMLNHVHPLEFGQLNPPQNVAFELSQSMLTLTGPSKVQQMGEAKTESLSVQETPVEPGRQPISMMMDDNSGDMNLIAPEVMAPEAPKQPTKVSEDFLKAYIPPSLPEEINALIDSYLFGRPLTIMVSRHRFRDHWALQLREEFGYAMLGFFRIMGVQETRIQVDGLKERKLPDGSFSGQVQWRFHLQWAPGGEELILPQYAGQSLDRPWWSPSVGFPPSPSVVATRKSKQQAILDEPESRYQTTPRYRAARIAHHEYQFRHSPLRDAYDSVVPELLLAPFGPMHMDRIFPRGWFCKDCGRMNFQAALRHRSCPSSFCENKPPPLEPYHHELFWIRDPQERLPINCPLNTFPSGVTATRTKWQNGTQTYSYHISENPNTFIKHIFASNVPRLQEPASAFMKDVQLNIPLIRPTVDNSLYFYYSVASPSDNTDPTNSPWSNVPDCINEVKDELFYQTSWFAEVKHEDISVNRLRIIAWITEGSKRGSEVIHAKKKCVTLLAMGCTTMMTVIPRSMGGIVKTDSNNEPGENAEEQVETGWVGGNVDDDPIAGEETPAVPNASPKKGKAAGKKKDRPSFVLSLFHGDIVVFFGDDFEYSIKRDGTSFFIFTSHDEVA